MIGALRERVTIERETRTADGLGGWSSSWAAVATVWARVEQLAAAEPVEAERLVARGGYRITIRHRSDLTTADRLAWRGRILNIRGLSNKDERRRYLTIDCDDEGT